MSYALPFAILQLLASAAVATRIPAIHVPQETPFVPGYFRNEALIPQPTSPPQVLRRLVPRDRATCGWMIADGSANTCGDSQYCTTSASGEFGVWNCCNPDSCYLQDSCSYSVECSGDSPYCVTSFMSNDGTTYSRFMCGSTSSIVFMAYSSEDTPQYTSSILSVSEASAESVSAASASAASQSAADASRSAEAESQTASPGGTSTSSPTNSSDKDDGLGAGAIAGIVVGAVGGIALIAGLAFIAYRMKKKNAGSRPAEMSGVPQQHMENYAKPYQYQHVHAQNGPPQNYYDASPQPPSELPSSPQHPQELPAAHQ
ncbi:hypothetical protein EJ04DRAFT_581245 [Polyplosphaeria fusca]|uniref:Carcinoembryonic antigen-related cell adhesion molecule 1 n=1 Tax=Polyplosphaeria fusca TaxID=682080 RepID=A0A9P4QLL1_9PLEO|nr:hypothetical protein EJ04DRAFT_581245 [Polyplosphaeria fusca]